MNAKFPKLLAGFEVYADWQERVASARRCAHGAFVVALIAVAVAVIIMGIQWLDGREGGFAVEPAWLFMFAIGGWCLTRSPLSRLYRYLLIAAAALILWMVLGLAAPSPQTPAGDRAWWRFLIPLAPLLVLAGGVVRAVLQDCKDSPFCLLSLKWRPKALLYGSSVGLLLFVQYFLAGIFAGALLPGEPLDAVGMVGRFASVILVAAVAEELIFRATIFDYLHQVRGINLWIAIFISMTINLIFYLPQAPQGVLPEQQALFWLGPAMLSITNALLWTWERGINSVIASNVIFRILHLLAQ
jgi:membrane protease YdiL (CAAX protease family)